MTHLGFSKQIFQGLIQPLSKVGYCLQPLPTALPYFDKEAKKEIRVLQMVATPPSFSSDSASPITLKINLFVGDTVTSDNLNKTIERPLASFPYFPGEAQSMEALVVQKIVENLKDRFICHLIIQSQPNKLNLYSDRGMNGVTPVEWVLPIGEITLSVKEKDYFTYSETINLSSPGEHEFLIKLKKKRFYHSRFMLPTLIGAVASGVAYALEKEYDYQYDNLGPDDLSNRPEKFEKKFNQAKSWERVKVASLLLTGTLFTLTFWF